MDEVPINALPGEVLGENGAACADERSSLLRAGQAGGAWGADWLLCRLLWLAAAALQ